MGIARIGERRVKRLGKSCLVTVPDHTSAPPTAKEGR
jgi:hypothetical protein